MQNDVFKVCNKCGDYPCHCGNEFKDKSDGFILETIKSLMNLYNNRVSKDDNKQLIILVGDVPLKTYLANLNESTTVNIITREARAAMKQEWIRHIRAFDNCNVPELIRSMYNREYTNDDFPFMSTFIIFLLQFSGQLDDRRFLQFLLTHLISRVKVTTYATINVLTELKGTLSTGLSEFSNHAWTVYNTLKDIPECDPKDLCLFKLFYTHVQSWLTEPTPAFDRYAKLLSLVMTCVSSTNDSYRKVLAIANSSKYMFEPNGDPMLRDDLFFEDKQVSDDIKTLLEQEIESCPDHIKILDD